MHFPDAALQQIYSEKQSQDKDSSAREEITDDEQNSDQNQMEPKKKSFTNQMFGSLDDLQMDNENRKQKHGNGQIAADAELIDVGNLVQFVIDVAVPDQVSDRKTNGLIQCQNKEVYRENQRFF